MNFLFLKTDTLFFSTDIPFLMLLLYLQRSVAHIWSVRTHFKIFQLERRYSDSTEIISSTNINSMNADFPSIAANEMMNAMGAQFLLALRGLD